jgi:signal transduction histidine kinase
MELLQVVADFAMSVVIAIFAVVIAFQLYRTRTPFRGPGIALVAFFALRAGWRLLDSALFAQSPAAAEVVIDIVSALLLSYLVWQSVRFGRSLRQRHDHALERAVEYERAQHHYTQVVRHRVMNPISVIEGTLQTLRDDAIMNPMLRRELCDAALRATDEIAQVSLTPERIDDVERDLDAIARPPA